MENVFAAVISGDFREFSDEEAEELLLEYDFIYVCEYQSQAFETLYRVKKPFINYDEAGWFEVGNLMGFKLTDEAKNID